MCDEVKVEIVLEEGASQETACAVMVDFLIRKGCHGIEVKDEGWRIVGMGQIGSGAAWLLKNNGELREQIMELAKA